MRSRLLPAMATAWSYPLLTVDFGTPSYEFTVKFAHI
jgi:hypothetical protein